MLQDLESKLNTFEAGIAKAHVKKNVEEYFTWIRNTGKRATFKEIEAVMKEIHQFMCKR